MTTAAIGEYVLITHAPGRPPLLKEYVRHATLVDAEGSDDAGGARSFFAVRRAADEWPFLVVSWPLDPGPDSGFFPGCALISETQTFFVGVGSRIAAFDLARPARLWAKQTQVGFWSWERHGELVLLSGELELAGYDLRGAMKWSTFVEPPWRYRVRDGRVELEVMGKRTSFPLSTGP